MFSIIFLVIFYTFVPFTEAKITNVNTEQAIDWSISWEITSTVKQKDMFKVYNVKVNNTGSESFLVEKFLVWIEGLNKGLISYPQNAYVREFTPNIQINAFHQETIISYAESIRVQIPKNFPIGDHDYSVGLQIDNDWTWISRSAGNPSFEVTRGPGKITWKNPKVYSGKGLDITVESSKNNFNTTSLGDYTIAIELDTADSCPLGDVTITAQTSNASWDDEDEPEPLIFYDSVQTYNEIENDTVKTILFSFNVKSTGEFDIRIEVNAENLLTESYDFHFNIKDSGGIPGFTIISVLPILFLLSFLAMYQRKRM